jgi:hypothetical protein
MSGWKMKTGSFMVAIGVVIAGSADVVPIYEVGPWLKFAGYIVGGVGSAFTIWGAGHKIEKGAAGIEAAGIEAAAGIEDAYALDQKCGDIISE